MKRIPEWLYILIVCCIIVAAWAFDKWIDEQRSLYERIEYKQQQIDKTRLREV